MILLNYRNDLRGKPIFDDITKFTTSIDTTKNYTGQMRQATRDLRNAINSGAIDSKMFNSDQLKAIQSGKSVIPDYTWHYNSQSGPNNMQLVPRKVHDDVSHVGQKSLSESK